MTRHSASRALLATAAVLAVLVPARSSAESFKLHIDPLIVEGNYFDVDTNSAKVNEYRDLSSGFRVTLLSLTGLTGDNDRKFDFQVVNGGKADAFYGMSYDVAGRWRMLLTYDNIPHNFGNGGHILYTQTRPGVWEIPDPVQQNLQDFAVANRPQLNFDLLNGALAPYLAAAHEVDLGLQRRRTRALIQLGSAGGSTWNLEYKHENRTGNRPFGSSFGFSNVTELPETIDYNTDDAILSGNWRFQKGIVTAGYQYSSFKNDVSTMIWDNPWRASDATDGSAYSAPGSGSVAGSSRGIFDLAPDNRAGTLFANGRFDLTTSSWLQAALNYVKYKQDDDLLPYTVNTSVNPANGAPFDASNPANQPYGSARRESTLTRVTLDYGNRFGDGWQADVRYNYQDYSDDSSRFEFPGYVRFDAVWEEVARITVPYSWTHETASADLSKDFGRIGTVGFEVRQDVWDRTYRETNKTTENIAALSWDGRFGKSLLRAKYEHGSRDFNGTYNTDAAEATYVESETSNNQPTLRRFDQASRKSDTWRISCDTPFAQTWDINLHANGAKYDYDESEFGLNKDDTLRYGFELSFDAGAGGSFFVFGDRTDRDVDQAARQSGATVSTNPADSWFAKFNEINDTWGVGWNKDHKRWHTKLLGQWERSDGKADLSSPPGGSPDLAVGFGNYEDYEIKTAQATADYDLTRDLSFGVRVLYEDYTINSFILQGVTNYLPGALLIAANDGAYQAWSAGLRMSVRF